MPEYYIWDDFKISFDKELICQKCHFSTDSKQAEILSALLVEAQEIAKPKMVVRVLNAEFPTEDQVVLDGVTIHSPLLYKRLSVTGICFPYVATCGVELAAWGKTKSGVREFLASEVMIQALRLARVEAEKRICAAYNFTMTSAMNPGSLPLEWPIQGQRELFQIMGDLPSKIEVTLLESYLMTPGKSVSGIQFPTKEKIHNCELCPKYDCPERRES